MHHNAIAIVARLLVLTVFALITPARARDTTPSGDDIIMQAAVDELDRSMRELVLEDLPRPYFIQYRAEDWTTFRARAEYGGLLSVDENRSRSIGSRVRVGSYELDNTNMGGDSGNQASLPLDKDYVALRHAIWRMTDGDYKHAVETLTRKLAYLKQKNITDRPEDFSPCDPVRTLEPVVHLPFDKKEWQERIKLLSGRFERYPDVQDSSVSFFAGATNNWTVNSEGTRLRTADTGVYVEIRAELQAEEGMRLADSLNYLGLQIEDLPSAEAMLADIDGLCEKLIALSKAPVLEHYTGPVLFEPLATGRVFESLLGEGLCARPTPLGSGGGPETSLEKQIGLRILPRSFQVHDDPGPQRFEGVVLGGAYSYDDEAVAPVRVTLVEKGILKTLLSSRAPTRKIKQTNGHGRASGLGDAYSDIGCLYVSDDNAMSPEELKQELTQSARDEGLEFALRVESMQPGGQGRLGNPIYAYKVYVDDGHEELIRGVQFLPVETRSLKHILAAGTERRVYNSTAGSPSSYIVPAVLFEELELSKIEREFDKLPILESPAERGK